VARRIDKAPRVFVPDFGVAINPALHCLGKNAGRIQLLQALRRQLQFRMLSISEAEIASKIIAEYCLRGVHD
jgi:hypothetical protein